MLRPGRPLPRSPPALAGKAEGRRSFGGPRWPRVPIWINGRDWGATRAGPRSPLPRRHFISFWSAQQTCPGRSIGKRRAGASSSRRAVSSRVPRCGPHHPAFPTLDSPCQMSGIIDSIDANFPVFLRSSVKQFHPKRQAFPPQFLARRSSLKYRTRLIADGRRTTDAVFPLLLTGRSCLAQRNRNGTTPYARAATIQKSFVRCISQMAGTRIKRATSALEIDV